MLTASIHSVSKFADKVRQTATQWWGGIGCRVTFLMSLAIFLVAVLIGAFFLWEGRRASDAEMRGKAFTIASYISSLAVDDIITENQYGLYRKITPAFGIGDGPDKEQDLAYLAVYGRNGQILFGKTSDGIIITKDLAGRSGQGRAPIVSQHINVGSAINSGPRFQRVNDRIYDYTLPVIVDGAPIGFVKLGISSQRVQNGSLCSRRKPSSWS